MSGPASYCGSLKDSCERCTTELRIEFANRVMSQKYPIAGLDQAYPDFPEEETPRGASSSYKIPTGFRVRNDNGDLEVLAPTVHRKLNVTSTLAMAHCKPPSRSLPEPGAGGLCGICFTDIGLVTFDCRQHPYCTVCIKQHMQDQLALGFVPLCPSYGCKADPQLDLVVRLLDKRNVQLYNWVSLLATNRCRTCPRPGCETMVFLPEKSSSSKFGARQSTDAPGEGDNRGAVTCPKCTLHFCLLCGKDAHPRKWCQDAFRSASSNTLRIAGMEVKPCPRCGVTICKADSDECDHMKCSQCKKEFCWLCLADRAIIYEHGNHYHLPHCRHFAAFNGPPEYLPEKCKECRRRKVPCLPPKV